MSWHPGELIRHSNWHPRGKDRSPRRITPAGRNQLRINAGYARRADAERLLTRLGMDPDWLAAIESELGISPRPRPKDGS
jgi:hypothetical protein